MEDRLGYLDDEEDGVCEGDGVGGVDVRVADEKVVLTGGVVWDGRRRLK